MQEQTMAWLFQGGSVSLPKRFLAFREALGLELEDLGALVYLLSLEGSIKGNDLTGLQAIRQLSKKNLAHWRQDSGEWDLTPLFSQLVQLTGDMDDAPPIEDTRPLPQTFAILIKRFEQEDGRFLSEKEKRQIMEVLQRFRWSAELVYVAFRFYLANKRRLPYDFQFFTQLAVNAGVTDIESFESFSVTLERDVQKVREILRCLGKYNNPTEAQKEMYGKWHRTWRFSHEMILLATEETVNADNPSFGYLDQILMSWQEQALKTPEDVTNMRQQRDDSRKARRKPASSKRSIRNLHFKEEKARDLNHLEE